MYIVDEFEKLKGNVILGVETTCCTIGVQNVIAKCFILKPENDKDSEERGIGFFNLHIEEHADDKTTIEEKNTTLPSFFQYYFLLSSDLTKVILKSYGFKYTDANVLMDLDDETIDALNKVTQQMKEYQNAKVKFQDLSFEIDKKGWKDGSEI